MDSNVDNERYSVCRFFPDGTYEYTRRNVGAQEASEAFVHYCTSIGAKLGTTARVIMTDTGDCIVAEWEWEEGCVFPDSLKGRYARGQNQA